MKRYRWELVENIACECRPKLSEDGRGQWINFEDNSFRLDGRWTLEDLRLILKAAEEFQKKVNELPDGRMD